MNNASVFDALRYELQRLGHTVITVSYRAQDSSNIKRTNYDYTIRKSNKHPIKLVNILLIVLSWFKKFFVFLKVLPKTDVFVFYWQSFIPLYLDYPIIKILGKKIVVCFCGDDARWHDGVNQEFSKLGLDQVVYPPSYDKSILGFAQRLVRIRMAERFANLVYSKREQAQLQIRPFKHYRMFSPDLRDRLGPNTKTQRSKPLILHAPTSNEIKGTTHVIKAVERLGESIDFDFELIQGLNREAFIQLLRDADIVIDQLLLPGGGRLSTESLALGCVVLTRMGYKEYDQGFPTSKMNCPIVDVNSSNLYNRLRSIVLDVNQRQTLADEGVRFVNDELLASQFVTSMIEALEEDAAMDYDPRYFRNEYKPKNWQQKSLIKLADKLIKRQSWYSKEKISA